MQKEREREREREREKRKEKREKRKEKREKRKEKREKRNQKLDIQFLISHIDQRYYLTCFLFHDMFTFWMLFPYLAISNRNCLLSRFKFF